MPKDAGQDRLLVRRYRLGRLLGSGAHGSVYLAEDLGRGGEQVALKVVEQVIGDAQPAEAERILQWFRHPNWAEILDTGRSGPRDWFQALRFVPGLNLEQVGAPQPEELVWKLLEDGARVLGALHRQGLIHYDVTPGNLILDTTSGRPRFTLTDGGLAHLGPVMGVARGTPRYMAPEVSTGAEHDHRSDLYSLGLVAYWLLTGTDPHTGGAGDVLGARRRADAPRASTRRPDVSRGLDELLASLLARNPNDRPADALALLAAIGQAQGCEVPPFLPEEIAALVAGGPLIGRGEEQERFAQSLSILAVHSGLAEEPAPRYPGTPLKDAVLVMRGPRGVGCTRLATRFAGLAREADVLVLRLSGRGGSDHSAALLPGLLQGLGLPRPRERQGASGEPRHGTQRDIERAIAALERLARKESVLLLVDSFAHLPDPDKEFVRTLARHLQARMSPGSPSALPLMLVVDAGEEPLEQFIPVTRQDSRAAEMALAPLATPDLVRVATERLGSLTLTDADGQRIAQRCEGLPGRLGSLLLEALRHGDLTYRHGTFILNPAHIDDYSLDAHLAPSLQMALQGLDDSETAFLRVLSILPEGLSVPAATAVYERLTGRAGLPTLAPLLRKTGSEPHERIHLAAPELRLSLAHCAATQDSAGQLAAAHDAISRLPSSADVLPTARLLHAAADTSSALTHLLTHWDWLPVAHQASARLLLNALVHSGPPAPDSLAILATRALTVLDASPEAADIVISLLDTMPTAHWPPPLRDRALQVLEARQQYKAAFTLIEPLLLEPTLAPEDRFSLHVQLARLHLDTHRPDLASAALRTARAHRRVLGEALPPLWALRYLTAQAQIQFLKDRFRRSQRLLDLAARRARRNGTPAARALVLNNMAIVEGNLDRRTTARGHLRRALRIRVALGDIPGQIKSLVNLGRLHQLSNELVLAASAFQHAAALAVRHGMPQQSSQALLLLARIYDAQANPRLASDAASQSLQAGALLDSQVPGVLAAWELGPIAASLGDFKRLSVAVAVSARAARGRATQSARGAHFLMQTRIHLHLGNLPVAAYYARRAYRHRHAQHAGRAADIAMMLNLTATILRPDRPEPLPTRPSWRSEARPAYRALLTFCRALRSTVGRSRRFPILALERPRFTGGEDRRMAAEAILAASSANSTLANTGQVELVERVLRHSGESWLRSRALAILALQPSADRTVPAATFSRAVGALSDWSAARFRSLRVVPREHRTAWERLTERSPGTSPSEPQTMTDLHALAHVLLVRSGAEQTPDLRTGAALRQIIRAAGRMNAGGSHEELLQDIVNHARDITGARRVCILLADSAAPARLTIARYSPMVAGGRPPQDISNTVLQRVTTSRSPLLLHDVFDDCELMGRPSITSMSLRSILCVPLIRGDTLYGLLYADSDSAMGSFDGTDLEVLALFAEQVAAMLEANRLLASLQNSMQELKAMQTRLVRGERLRTIGELSSSVAHEFNNLLTSILARVQLLQMQPLGASVSRDLLLVERACLDAAEVVRRLQTFSKQQREQHFAQVDLCVLTHDAVEFLRPLWSTRRRHERSRVAVTLKATKSCIVRGDATELREVITNLLKNALDALPRGGSITLDVEAQGEEARVLVCDTGVGIPSTIADKVFDPFFTTKGERGTGLGLSICQQIVERHGGRINIRSEEGRGTQVEVRIPLVLEPSLAPIESDPTPVRRGLARILVVDDDENVLVPLSRFLAECGYEVNTAPGGLAALRAVRASQPDLVLTDITMPGMDGLQLCEAIRAEAPTTIVLLMSGRTSGIPETEVIRRGASALISKPFSLAHLADSLSMHLSGRPERTGANS